MSLLGYEETRQIVREVFPDASWTSESTAVVPVRGVHVSLTAVFGERTSAVRVRIPIDGSPPVSMWIMHRDAAAIGAGAKPFPTGDPAFDSSHTLRGAPHELVWQAVDAPLREVIVGRFPRASDIEVREGEVRCDLSRREIRRGDLPAMVDALAYLAIRVAALHRARIDQARAAGGDAAARELEGAMRAELELVEGRRSRASWVVLGCVLLFIVAILVLAAGLAWQQGAAWS